MDKEKQRTIRFHTMAVILIVIVAATLTPITFQNDTYYSIKIGEYVVNNGVTMKEPFAWHENLSYPFPHWGYDTMLYLIYSVGGFTGVYISTIIFASILGILIYFVNVKLAKNKIISFVLTIIVLYLLGGAMCARAQLITFILFILTVYFIEQFLNTKKIRYALGLIIIPILIANFHVAVFPFYFVLYLPYFAEYMIYILSYCNVIISESVIKSINKKIAKNGETEELLKKLHREQERHEKLKNAQDNRIEKPYKIKIEYNNNVNLLIIVFIICLFTGLLTPLGSTPYTYLVKTMQGISPKNISEHLPVVLIENIRLLLLLVAYIVILMLTKVKIRLSHLFMLAGLVFLSLSSKRHATLLYIISSFILNELLIQFLLLCHKDVIKKLEELASTILGIIIISTIIIVISVLQYRTKMNDKYVDENSYPVKAAQWIKENLNLDEIKLYNEYNYGSYLLFQDIPVFIDSRCDLYMPEFNDNAYMFYDFLHLNGWSFSNEKMEEKINEYGFTHFILINGVRFKQYIEDRPDEFVKIYPTGDIEDERFTIYERK